MLSADSFLPQVAESLLFSASGFSIISEVATPPQPEVIRCSGVPIFDACPAGFSEVPSRIKPLLATP